MGPDSDQANVLLLTFKTKIEEAISLVNQMPEDLRLDAWLFWQKVSTAIKEATVGLKERKRFPGGKDLVPLEQKKKEVVEEVEEDVVEEFVLDSPEIVNEDAPVSEEASVIGQEHIAQDLKLLYHSVYTKETADAVEAMICQDSPNVFTIKDTSVTTPTEYIIRDTSGTTIKDTSVITPTEYIIRDIPATTIKDTSVITPTEYIIRDSSATTQTDYILKDPIVTSAGCILTEQGAQNNAIDVVVQNVVNDQVITSLVTIDKANSPLKKSGASPKKKMPKTKAKKVEINADDKDMTQADQEADTDPTFKKAPKKRTQRKKQSEGSDASSAKSSRKRKTPEPSEDIVSKALAENFILPPSEGDEKIATETEVGETPLAENNSSNTKRKKPRRSSRAPKPKKLAEGLEGMEDGVSEEVEGEKKKRVKGENKVDMGPVDCTVCGIKLAYYSSLAAHMRKHTGDRPFICSLCSKQFTTKANMLRHERTHSGEKPFECEVCSKCFTEKKTLKIHMRCHTGERPYECPECGQCFSQSGTLKSHMHRHSGHKGNLCDLCGRAFRQKTQLRIHLKRHFNLKAHKCDKCDLTFYCKADLNRHEVKHASVKPYACSQCPKTYSRLQYLKEHENSHKGITKYDCDQCDLSFSEHATFYRHKQKHKRENEESVHLVVDSEAMENETVDSVPALLVTADHIQHLFGVNSGGGSEVYRIALVDQTIDNGQVEQEVNEADFSAINLLASATTQLTQVPDASEELKQIEF